MKVIHVRAFLLPVLVLMVTITASIIFLPEEILWIHYPLDAFGAQDYELAWIFNYGLIITGILMGVWKNENLFEYNDLHSEEGLSHQRFYLLINTH